MMLPELNVILLHDQMADKNGKIVCTSLTMIDVHDIARSSCTYGVKNFFVAHPSDPLRNLAGTLKKHWESGHGSTYNPNRKEALEQLQVVRTLDDAIEFIHRTSGRTPCIIASSARNGGKRIGFTEMRKVMNSGEGPYLLMLGTGWGMSDALLNRADYFLEPVCGPGEYNHLSVRSACAIMLDRLCAPGREQ